MTRDIIPYEIYTDGSCKKITSTDKTGFGGWAFIIVYDGQIIHSGHGTSLHTTSQRMELIAVIRALEYISKAKKTTQLVEFYSDSAYFINCYLNEWYKTWLKNGWRTTNMSDVANKDLWTQIIPYFNRTDYNFYKVKGHANNQYNNMVDTIAQGEAQSAKTEWRGEQT